MKKVIHALLIGGLLFSSSVMVSCRKCCYDYKNPECENYDPCRANPLSNADFDIVSYYIDPNTNLHIYYKVPEYDTIGTGNFTFKCWQGGNDSVLWKIGSEKKYRRGDSIQVFFDGDVPGTEGPITIICITYRKPNPKCKVGDDGRDTVIKHYVIRSEIKGYNSFNGIFRGCNSAKPKDTFNVTIIYCTSAGFLRAYYNLPNGYHSKDFGPWDNTIFKESNRFATSADGPVFLLNKTLDSIHVEIPSSDHWGFYPGSNPDPIYKNPTTFNGYRIK